MFLSATELSPWLLSSCGGRPSGIIFDCDGVVIDSRDANISYYNYLRNYVGLPALTRAQEDFVQAATYPQAIDKFFPRPLQPLLREATKKFSYEKEILPHIRTYPGLHELLGWCRENGVRTAMDTNRHDGMDILLETCSLHGCFDPLVLASHVRHPKPSPDGAQLIIDAWGIPGERLVFIGDSASDKGAAEGARIPFLAYRNESLAEHSFRDFPILLEALKSLS